MSTEEIIIRVEDPRSSDAVQLLIELTMCLQSITGDGGQSSIHVDDVLCIPRSLFAIARNLKKEAIGCGAFRPMDEKLAEVKRMYVRKRSSGAGSKLLFLFGASGS